MRRQFLSDVLAIEREAAAPAATEALRAALEQIVREFDAGDGLTRGGLAAARAALASPEPTPAVPRGSTVALRAALDPIDDAICYGIAFLNDPEGLAPAREEWRDQLRAALHSLRALASPEPTPDE